MIRDEAQQAMGRFTDSVKELLGQVFGKADFEHVLKDHWDFADSFPEEQRLAMSAQPTPQPERRPLWKGKPQRLSQTRPMPAPPIPFKNPEVESVPRIGGVDLAMFARDIVEPAPRRLEPVLTAGAPHPELESGGISAGDLPFGDGMGGFADADSPYPSDPFADLEEDDAPPALDTLAITGSFAAPEPEPPPAPVRLQRTAPPPPAPRQGLRAPPPAPEVPEVAQPPVRLVPIPSPPPDPAAASLEDLEGMVSTQTFRADLYHRLNVMQIAIPPLRERRADIVPLAEHLLASLKRRYRASDAVLSDAGRERLVRYPWPGNVRELSHELERQLILTGGGALDFASLSSSRLAAASGPAPEWLSRDWRIPEEGFSIEEAMHRLIDLAMEQTRGNLSAAARLLGVNRDYVRYRLDKRKGP